jgi:4-amino-4-deoxy-L-arabinose transferase-like glycosyltransferase
LMQKWTSNWILRNQITVCIWNYLKNWSRNKCSGSIRDTPLSFCGHLSWVRVPRKSHLKFHKCRLMINRGGHALLLVFAHALWHSWTEPFYACILTFFFCQRFCAFVFALKRSRAKRTARMGWQKRTGRKGWAE